MSRFITIAYGSIWVRLFFPLALLGVNGVSLNLVAWELTRTGRVDLNAIADSFFVYVYFVSAALFSAYEMGRARREAGADDYGKRLLNTLQPEIEKHCKDLISQGKVEEVYQNIDKARIVYNSPPARSRRSPAAP